MAVWLFSIILTPMLAERCGAEAYNATGDSPALGTAGSKSFQSSKPPWASGFQASYKSMPLPTLAPLYPMPNSTNKNPVNASGASDHPHISSALLRSNASACPSIDYTQTPISYDGSGYEFASQCLRASLEYQSAISLWNSAIMPFPSFTADTTFPAVTVTETELTSSPVVPTSAIYTDCDGYPHFVSGFTPSSTITTSMAYTTGRPASTETSYITAPQYSGCQNSWTYVACTFPPSDCSLVENIPATILGKPQHISCPNSLRPPRCTVAASSVQLYYWPATTTGDPFCDGTNGMTWHTVPPSSGTQVATIALGSADGFNSSTTITMTSPSVYLAIYGISATIPGIGASPTPVGTAPHPTGANAILSRDPDQLQSMEVHLNNFTGPWTKEIDMIVTEDPRAYPEHASSLTIGTRYQYWWSLTQTARPYNLFNLQRSVPASDYLFRVIPQNTLLSNNPNPYTLDQDVTVRNDYHAFIPVPTELKAMNSAWADCDLYLNGIYDPPQAISTGTFTTNTPSPHKVGPPAAPAVPAPTPPPPAVSTAASAQPLIANPQFGHATSETINQPSSIPVVPSSALAPPPVVSNPTYSKEPQQLPPSQSVKASPGQEPLSPNSQPASRIENPGTGEASSNNPGNSQQQAGTPGGQKVTSPVKGPDGNTPSPVQPMQAAETANPGNALELSRPAPTDGPAGQSNAAAVTDAATKTHEHGIDSGAPGAIATHQEPAPIESQATTSVGDLAGSLPLAPSETIISLNPAAPSIKAVQTTAKDGQALAIVSDNTLAIGNAPATINSATFSLASNGIVVGNQNSPDRTISMPAADTNFQHQNSPMSGAVFTIASTGAPLTAVQTTAPNGQPVAIVAGSTLSQGQALTINGGIVSLNEDGNVAVAPTDSSSGAVSTIDMSHLPASIFSQPDTTAHSGAIVKLNPTDAPITAVRTTAVDGHQVAVAAGHTLEQGHDGFTTDGSVMYLDEHGNVAIKGTGSAGAASRTVDMSLLPELVFTDAADVVTGSSRANESSGGAVAEATSRMSSGSNDGGPAAVAANTKGSGTATAAAAAASSTVKKGGAAGNARDRRVAVRSVVGLGFLLSWLCS